MTANLPLFLLRARDIASAEEKNLEINERCQTIETSQTNRVGVPQGREARSGARGAMGPATAGPQPGAHPASGKRVRGTWNPPLGGTPGKGRGAPKRVQRKGVCKNMIVHTHTHTHTERLADDV